jgi:3-hydroxymyristoyl/3-hydroxydecanoyl-(acyl carrier protein) dehydratase
VRRDLRLAFAADHPAFAGHFPGNPVLPGVALLDAALAELAVDGGLRITDWRLAAAKFHTFVRPGEPLILHSEVRTDGSIQFATHRDATLVASGVLQPTRGPDAPDA